MATANPGERSLKGLLDGLILSQKQDIHAFSGGHLNEANLTKLPKSSERTLWESAKVPHNPPQKHTQAKDKKANGTMHESLLRFSVGTAGTIALPPVLKTPFKGTRGPLKLTDREVESAGSKGTKSSYAKRDDGILVEELKLPELVLKTPHHDSSSDFHPQKSPNLRGLVRNSAFAPKVEPSRQYVQCFQEAATKRDQFYKMKTLQSDMLRIQDENEKETLSGFFAMEKLEAKLGEGLGSLAVEGDNSTNNAGLRRLEVFSQVFDDLLENSTLPSALSQIKEEYDFYVSYLLTVQSEGCDKLRSRMEQLSSRGPTNPQILTLEAERLLGLEDETRRLLVENSRLQKEVEYELGVVEESLENEMDITSSFQAQLPKIQLGTQVTELHAALLEKLDQIADVRSDLKANFVPASVCSHLEQCIKETEIQTQRLVSQKEYYEKIIAEMEAELEELIETADTTEKDAKRVWKRINAVKAISRGGQLVFGYDSDSETDEEAKWNWYIS